MSRNPDTCPHNILDVDFSVTKNGEAISENETYCTECGTVLDNISECCGVPIKNGFCSDCMEHAE